MGWELLEKKHTHPYPSTCTGTDSYRYPYLPRKTHEAEPGGRGGRRGTRMLSGTASRCHSPFQQRGAPGHFEPPEALRSLRTRRRLGGQRRTSLLGPPCPRRYKTSPSEAPTARAAPCPAPLRSPAGSPAAAGSACRRCPRPPPLTDSPGAALLEGPVLASRRLLLQLSQDFFHLASPGILA